MTARLIVEIRIGNDAGHQGGAVSRDRDADRERAKIAFLPQREGLEASD
jgi:hypothetical protein